MDIHKDVKGTGSAPAAKAPLTLPKHLSTSARYPVVELGVRNQASRAIRSPRHALGFAAYAHAISRTDKDRQLALAWVDVMVSGRRAHAALAAEKEPLLDRDVLGAIPPGLRTPVEGKLAASLTVARARLEEVRRFVDSDGVRRKRPTVGGCDWVAGAPEVDRPHVPLNVGVADDIGWRRIRAGDLDVRYVVTGDLDHKKSKVVLYLHGLGSRAEEGVALGKQLSRLGDYVVVAPDLPGQGYTEPVPVGGPGRLDVADKIEEPGNLDERYLFLAYLDRFVDELVDALDGQFSGLRDRLVCVGGGSLGGNLALRATLRKTSFPLRSIASWSAGSVWDSFTKDPFQRLAASETYRDATMDEHLDSRTEHWISSTGRDAYLSRTFEQQFAIDINGKKLKARGPEMWWRKGLEDFAAREANSLADRLEVYDETFRRWQSRLAYEQLLFSHRAAGRLQLLCGKNGKTPALLLAGEMDNAYFANIHDRVHDIAEALAKRGVPGACYLLKDTGHSIHDERPKQLAGLLDTFLRAQGLGA
jgi:pimeloyl-ACP methyl ester carboxylesterase